MFDKMAKVGSHIRTAKLLEFESLSTDRALVYAGKCFEQSSSPLIDMFECDITSQGMNNRLDKEDTFFRIWKVFIEHLYLPHMALVPTVQQHDLPEVLLEDLNFL